MEKNASYEIREVSPGYSYVVNFECPSQWDSSLEKLPLPGNFELSSAADKMYHSWQKGLAYEAMAALYKILEATQVTDHSQQQRSARVLKPVLDYLGENLTDPELQMYKLPEIAGVSEAYLRRLFKKKYGLAPAAYVLQCRMELAKKLLTGTDTSIAQVANQVGYRDPLYFSRLFRRQVGLTPTQYRQMHTDDLF